VPVNRCKEHCGENALVDSRVGRGKMLGARGGDGVGKRTKEKAKENKRSFRRKKKGKQEGGGARVWGGGEGWATSCKNGWAGSGRRRERERSYRSFPYNFQRDPNKKILSTLPRKGNWFLTITKGYLVRKGGISSRWISWLVGRRVGPYPQKGKLLNERGGVEQG